MVKNFNYIGLGIFASFILLLVILLCVFLIPGVIPGKTVTEPILSPDLGIILPTLAPFEPSLIQPDISTLEPIRISTWEEYDLMTNSSDLNNIFLLNKNEFDLVMADGIKKGFLKQEELVPYDEFANQFKLFLGTLGETPVPSE